MKQEESTKGRKIAAGVFVAVALASILIYSLYSAEDDISVQHQLQLSVENVTSSSCTLLNTYKVDGRYFYQGLEFVDGTNETKLLMSEGWWGTSNLAILDVDNTQL